MRHATIILPSWSDWVATTAKARDADAGLPIAYELKPFEETASQREVQAS